GFSFSISVSTLNQRDSPTIPFHLKFLEAQKVLTPSPNKPYTLSRSQTTTNFLQLTKEISYNLFLAQVFRTGLLHVLPNLQFIWSYALKFDIFSKCSISLKSCRDIDFSSRIPFLSINSCCFCPFEELNRALTLCMYSD